MARLIDGGTVGTDLLAEVCGCERLLIVDAVDAGLAPGTTVWMDLSGPDPGKIDTRNAHQFGIPGLLDDLRLLGQAPARWFWWASNRPRWDWEPSCRRRSPTP